MQDESKIRQSSYTEGLIHPSCQAVNEGRRQKRSPGALPDCPHTWPGPEAQACCEPSSRQAVSSSGGHPPRPLPEPGVRCLPQGCAGRTFSKGGRCGEGLCSPNVAGAGASPREKNKGVQLQGTFVYCPVCFNVAVGGVCCQELLYFGSRSSDHVRCSPRPLRCRGAAGACLQCWACQACSASSSGRQRLTPTACCGLVQTCVFIIVGLKGV